MITLTACSKGPTVNAGENDTELALVAFVCKEETGIVWFT